jgi:dual specificity MAP kinase phosphatase
MSKEIRNIVVIHSFDFQLIISNAVDIIGNFANLMLKRFKKILAQSTQFLLHENSSDFEQLKKLLEQSDIKILFLCVNINNESLELIKLSYPESDKFEYKILSEDECLEQFPDNFSRLDAAITTSSTTSSTTTSTTSTTSSTSSLSSYNISPNSISATLFDNSISTIIPNKLYLSNYVGASNLEELLKHNITHIINITDLIENYFENETDIYNNPLFKYLKISIPDALNINITDYFQQAFEFIDDAINDGNSVLVHCFAGKSRSASIVIGYIMKIQKKNFYEVLKFVQNIRPCVDPNLAFCTQLMSYNPTVPKYPG